MSASDPYNFTHLVGPLAGQFYPPVYGPGLDPPIDANGPLQNPLIFDFDSQSWLNDGTTGRKPLLLLEQAVQAERQAIIELIEANYLPMVSGDTREVLTDLLVALHQRGETPTP